jgi:hypothetical protein
VDLQRVLARLPDYRNLLAASDFLDLEIILHKSIGFTTSDLRGFIRKSGRSEDSSPIFKV